MPSPSKTGTEGSASSTDKASGLSTGAKAGIGLGVAIRAIAVLSAVAFFTVKRRREAYTTGTQPERQVDKSRGEVKYDYFDIQPAEIHDAGSTSKPAEVQGAEYMPYKPYRAELAGDRE